MPTVRSPIPETEKFRRERDAWADSRRVWTDRKKWFISGTDVNAGDHGGAPAQFEGGSIPQVTWRKGKTQIVSGKAPLETRGASKALDSITDRFMRAAIAETDVAVSKAAFEIWNAWPSYTGLSKSSLALAWGTGSSGIEVRLIEMVDYVFKARPTREAWASARRIWNQVPEKVGESLRARRL